MIYGSVCSGIEAATVAWRRLGWSAAWFAEIDPFCSALLQHRYPNVRNYGDFTRIDSDAGPVDILVGGTPCQSFSVAGKRAGLADPRGNLTLEYIKLAERLRPRWLVWENVPGVLSIDQGRTFGSVLGIMGQLGYGFAYRILNAQFFGVPQRRRRVFVVAHLGDWRPAAAVLFERESLRGNSPASREPGKIVTAITANSVGTCGGDPKQAQAGHIIAAFGGNNTSGAIDTAAALNAHPTRRYDFESETLIAHTLRGEGFDASPGDASAGVPIIPVDLSIRGTLNGNGKAAGSATQQDAECGLLVPVAFRAFGQDGFVPRETTPPILASDDGGVAAPVVFESRFVRNGRGSPDTVVPPLKAQSGRTGKGDGAPLLATEVAVRRLTPRECERLQGFEDDYTLVPNYRCKLSRRDVEEMAAYLGVPLAEARKIGATPDGPRYKAIGNSMAVPCMEYIGRRIAQVEELL